MRGMDRAAGVFGFMGGCSGLAQTKAGGKGFERTPS
jgi:hypothetical protein